MIKKINIHLFLFVFFVSSCVSDSTEYKNISEGEGLGTTSVLDLKYAENFSVQIFDWGYRVDLGRGVQGGHHVVELVRDSFYDGQSLVEGVVRILIPIKRCALNSSTYLEFICLLQEVSSLVGLCNAEYLYNEIFYQLVRSGEVIQLGSSMQVNEERLLLADPQVLFLSDARESLATDVCPILVCSEWQERTALGRAEWIKFFSLFYDKLSMADSLFDATEQRYMEVKSLAKKDTIRPTVFAAAEFGGTWYLTGGKGYMRSIYEDANADFLLKDSLTGTITTGLEWVLANFHEADFWMNCQKSERTDLDERLSIMKAYKDGNVFHFNKRSVKRPEAVISDFYESAVAHPDRLLKDVVSVIHPSVLEEYETVYLGRMK